MLTGVLMWIDAQDARSEIDAAAARGVAPGLIDNLRAALQLSIDEGDIESVDSIAQYAARLGPDGSMTVDTPADVAVQGALDTAQAVKSAAAATETLLVVGVVIAALVAWSWSRGA